MSEYSYDDSNIFARILRGEIPCDKVAENDVALAFRDISPKLPVHVLVIPKGKYVNFDHFAAAASEAELAGFMRLTAQVSADLGIAQSAGGQGYRAITNAGPHGVQEVPHFHLHLLGGAMAGPMISARG